MAYKNDADRKEYRRRYRKDNAERLKEYNRKWAAEHREYYNERMRIWRDKRKAMYPEKFKEKRQSHERYGDFDYYAQLARQGGKCAICGAAEPGHKKKYFCVDHDHATDVVRELLCGACNKALGFLGDSPEIADKAAAYLRRHGKQPSLWQITPNGEASLSPELLL